MDFSTTSPPLITRSRASRLPPSEHSFFVSVHIPKTAGTTLGLILDRVFRKRVLMDYPDDAMARTPDPDIADHAEFVARYFKGIHGHFSVQRHLTLFPAAKTIATLRHPVDRVISQYLHELNDSGFASAYHGAIRDGMSVVDFAGMAGVGDAMTRYLDGVALQDYDLLLISERLEESLHVLNYVLGNLDIPQHYGSPPQLPRENKATERATMVRFDAATRQAIYTMVGADIDTYRRAREHYARKARQYLG